MIYCDGSIHLLTMCMESDFQKWKNGELIYDYDKEELVPYTDEIRKKKEEDGCMEYITYENFNDWSYFDLESFEQEFITPSGEKVIGFGYFGYDD